jgi:diguanylate cyclase (GGDEF)-like protein/PAS domain S-box-containing protein
MGPVDDSLEKWAAYAAEFAPDMLGVVDPDGHLLWVSRSAHALLGYDSAPLLGTSIFELAHPDDLGYATGALQEAVRKEGLHYPVEIRVLHADGHWTAVEITTNTPELGNGSRNMVLALRPTAQRETLPARRRDFETLFAAVAARCAGATWQAVDDIVRNAIGELGTFFHASTVLFALAGGGDARLNVEFYWKTEPHGPDSRPAGALHLDTTGWSAAEMPAGAQFVEDVAGTAAPFPEARAESVRSQLVVPVTHDGALSGVLILQWTESGDPYWDDALGVYAQGLARILTSTVRRARDEAEVYYQSLHDPLTGLANRSKLLIDLRRALGGLTAESRGGLALLYCDVDGFKQVNDEYGHEVGDRVLIEIADRIRSSLRPGDSVSRLGGDEFVVLCHRIDDSTAAGDVATRIRATATSAPPRGLTDHLDLSVGIAWTDTRRGATELLREADLAMYRVKQERQREHDEH